MRIVIFMTVALGLVSAVGCDNAAGPSTSASAETSASGETSAAPAKAPRAVDVTVDDKGFHPNHVEVKKGEKLQLRFKRTHDGTCATDVVFSEIDIKKPLPLNEVVTIDVPTDQARTLAFQCGMGMYKSSVVVN